MSKRPASPTPIKVPPLRLDNLESDPTEGSSGHISPVQGKNICVDVADEPKTLSTGVANLTEGSLLAHDRSLREPSVHEGSPTPPAKEKPVFEPVAVPAISDKSDGVVAASQNLSPPSNVLSATHNLSISSHQGMVTYLNKCGKIIYPSSKIA